MLRAVPRWEEEVTSQPALRLRAVPGTVQGPENTVHGRRAVPSPPHAEGRQQGGLGREAAEATQ